jgi:histidine phosphotransferase ChpT
MTSSTDLAALLCSRLCHDLLSPVGALSNGLELLADEKDPEMRKRCFELLEQSAKISTDKLKFFRLAYGAAGGFGDEVPSDEPRSLIAELIAANGRVTLEWAVADAVLPKPAVKVLLNLSAIALDALIRGGTLSIGAERRNGTTEIAVRAAGQRVAFDANIGKALDGSLDTRELAGRTAPAHMIRLLAEDLGGGLQYALSA